MSFNADTINFKNPKYTKKGFIDVEIEHPKLGWIEYTCSPLDDDPSDITKCNKCLFERISSLGNIAPYVPRTLSDEQLSLVARDIRNSLLISSDWSQLPDIPDSVRNVWVSYRQKLRDITSQPGYPKIIDWPKNDPDGKPTNVVWPPDIN